VRAPRLLGLVFAGLLVYQPAWADDTAAAPAPETARPLSVLPATDSSGLGMETSLQNELATLFQQTQSFTVSLANQTLPAFTSDDITRMATSLKTEILSFVYLEKDRLAIFLFDTSKQGKFLVSSEPLNNSPDGRLTTAWIDNQFRVGFAQLFRAYVNGDYQSLPGSEMNDKEAEAARMRDNESRDRKARRLFRELSSLQDTTFYWGLALGVSRIATNGPGSSTVDVSGLGGWRVWDRARLEAGINLFSYLMFNIDAKLQIPLAEKYLSLYVGLGGALVATNVTQNRNFGSVQMSSGSLLGGPAFSFDVPLVGANIRGEIKYYQGSGSVLIATYGVTYSF
jgi:hypothetical protein